MSYRRPETLTYLIYTRNLLFDRDGSNIQIFLSLLKSILNAIFAFWLIS